MRITFDEVRTTAALARLALPADQDGRLRLTAELDRILDYAAQLQELDLTGVEPTTHAVPLMCPLRPDQVGAHLSQEEALANAPRDGQKEGFFAVPAILDRDER